MSPTSRTGQSLIELVIAVAIAIVFITAAIGAITLSLRIDSRNKFAQAGGELSYELLDQIATFANADWHNVDLLDRAENYSLATSTGFFTIVNGSTTITLDGISYEVGFTVQDVYRGSAGEIVESGGTLDPATLRIVATTSWEEQGSPAALVTYRYLARTRDRLMLQSSWHQGSSTAPSSPVSDLANYFSNATNTNWSTQNQLTIEDYTKNVFVTPSNGIDPAYRYAWNDVIGWIDFLSTNTVTVGSTVAGYVSSSVGYIALDCATSPTASCSPSNYGVSYDNGGTGFLYGYAWSDGIGWISFNCSNSNQCATTAPCPSTNPNCAAASGGIDYYTWIDGSGYFHGYAWNDVIGWIGLNCAEAPGGCGAVSYKVRTGSSSLGRAELESITYDTTRIGGAGFNTIMWHGSLAADTNVNFQIATSNCPNGEINPPTCSTGTWNFMGPTGSSDYYQAQPSEPNLQAKINKANHNNERYLRYKVYLYSDPTQSAGPTVNQVILNWSH